MKTIIDFWNGNIAPCEHCDAHDALANQLIALMERNRENLCRGLSDEQKKTFEKYIDCSEDDLLRMLELAFCDGFSLGCRLTGEVLS